MVPPEPPRHPVDEVVAPYLSSREAAETLIAAVERAGDPWQVLRGPALVGSDLGAIRSWPLVLPHGELLGIVTRSAADPSDSDELIRVLLRTFVTLVAAEESATEVTRRAVEAEQEARRDALTGLLNRRAWDDALAAETARMARHRHPALVLVIDVDGLKEVNDVQGHLAGDLLLRRTASALRGALREEDLVARIGGDEFAALAVEADEESKRALLGRLRAALLEADVDASVGAAAAEPGASLRETFERADQQMYEAKRLRKELASGALRDPDPSAAAREELSG
jgi:diguanylate cyclase (GGDEF)-like protein